MHLSKSEDGRRLIGVHDTMGTALLGLRNYVRINKERFLIFARTIDENKNRETTNEYKKRKQNKGQCKIWGKHEDSVHHLLHECSNLAQKEYKR